MWNLRIFQLPEVTSGSVNILPEDSLVFPALLPAAIRNRYKRYKNRYKIAGYAGSSVNNDPYTYSVTLLLLFGDISKKKK